MRGQSLLLSKDSKNDTLVKTEHASSSKKKACLFFPHKKLQMKSFQLFSLKWNQKKCHLPPVLTLINSGFLLITSDQKKGCCQVQGGVKTKRKKNIITKCLRPTEISPSGQDLSTVNSPPLFSHQYSRPVGVEPALKCRLGQRRGSFNT